MPWLVIDDREIEVPKGTKIIDAAEKLGIMIPRFCYHEALGAVGACRMCAVKFLQGPFKGVQMSCMIDAQDGMVVSTNDAEAVAFRKSVIEWLMLHHPHDCPVCDEGGHCLLQDETVSGGHGIRRYRGKKRTYRDQYLGPLLQHEMNRCIQCYRCSRFYQEFTGYRDLGAMQIANRVFFGRFREGVLESPFSGNLIDICPTGVYTDKPSRFFGRRWDYERGPSVCIHCSLGCHTVASARYRNVVRQEARYSEAVNGHFICDRGRYGHFYASNPQRPRRAKIEGQETDLLEAMKAAVTRLTDIVRESGPSAVAGIGSVRSSLETLGALVRLCRKKGWRGPSVFMEPSSALRVKTAVSRLDSALAVSLREMEGADFILAVGVDPVNEAPMLALAMRQAFRKGSEVAIIDPRPVSLPFSFRHLPVAPSSMALCLGTLIRECVDRSAAETLGPRAVKFYDTAPSSDWASREFAREVGDRLRSAGKPVIVCGTEAVSDSVPHMAADLALLLGSAKKKAGLFYVFPGADAFGAGMLGGASDSLAGMIEAVEKRTVRALILSECDPFRTFGDRKRLDAALSRLDLLVVLDCLDSESVKKAHVFLPTATLFEADGVFINQEGRAQKVLPVHRGGTPILQTGGGSHPPRIYGTGMPGGDPFPAWQMLAQMENGGNPVDASAAREEIGDWLKNASPGFQALQAWRDIPREGVRIISSGSQSQAFSVHWSSTESPAKGLEAILTDRTFGTEELSSLSPPLAALEGEPAVLMHREDADSMGLKDGDRVIVKGEKGSMEAVLRTFENMARGVLVIPRHHKLPWQDLGMTSALSVAQCFSAAGPA